MVGISDRPLKVEEVAEEIAEEVAINSERDPAFNRDEVLEDPFDTVTIRSRPYYHIHKRRTWFRNVGASF
jgi:hypothetical protein